MIRELKNILVVFMILGFLNGCQGTANNEVENNKEENVVENESSSKVVELQLDGLRSSFVLGDSVSEFESTVREFIKGNNPDVSKWNFDFSTVNYEKEGTYSYTVYFDELSVDIEMSILRPEEVERVVESYVCFNIETDEFCEAGQGPEINVLHNDNFDSSNEVFYIPHTFKTEMEYAEFLISTQSFNASDQQDGDVELAYGFDLEENVFLLFAEDSDGNSTHWAIPAVLNQNKPTFIETEIVSGNSTSNDSSLVDNSDKVLTYEEELLLLNNVEPGAEKIVMKDKAQELTNMFASEGNFMFEPATIFVKYITPSTFFTMPHYVHGCTYIPESGTIYLNTRKDFSFDLDKIPMVYEDLNSNIPLSNVSYDKGILKYDRTYSDGLGVSFVDSYKFDWNKGTMELVSRRKDGVGEIVYGEYDAHTRISIFYQSYEDTYGCDAIRIVNHATNQYWMINGAYVAYGENSVHVAHDNIMDIYLSEHSDELIMH